MSFEALIRAFVLSANIVDTDDIFMDQFGHSGFGLDVDDYLGKTEDDRGLPVISSQLPSRKSFPFCMIQQLSNRPMLTSERICEETRIV